MAMAASSMHAANLGMQPITSEIAKEAFQKYQQMRSAGASETDPEFIRVRNILQYVKSQQHKAQSMQAHPNGAIPQNSNNNSMHPQHPSANRNGTPASTVQSPGMQNGNHAEGSSGHMIMSKEQRTLLQQQINAYRYLARDAPVPREIQLALFASQRPVQSPQAPNRPQDAVNKSADNRKPAASDIETEIKQPPPPQQHYETSKDPYSYLEPMSYYDHASRAKRLIVPSIMGPGLDMEAYRNARENTIYNNMLKRKKELEKLPINWAQWDTTKTDEPTVDNDRRLKLLIEYKSLCFLAKQRDLRKRYARDLLENNTLAMAANRSKYRRAKRINMVAAKNTEHLERQQREARMSKEKEKHQGHLRAIINHGLDIRNAAMESSNRVKRIGGLVMSMHQTIEKEEQKRVERTAKQRLQALKANDEETYLKLLGQAKDSRISHLLKQTDNFLNQLAASVKSQQRTSGIRDAEDGSEEEDEVAEDDDDELDEEGDKKSKIDYYEVAHRVKEEVTKQSNNLIGGTLKEYQLKGLQWMISLYNNKLNGILADEMGLGKTIQTISLITYLIEKKKQPGPYIVIVPLSTLTNWNNEFEKWAPSVERIVYKGPPTSRKNYQAQIRSGNFQVLLTTYEFIIKDRPILSRVKWLHMIVDEGHRMKNAQSKLSYTITNYYSTKYRLILTGTPLQNNLPELWALLNFVLPNIFKSVKSFDDWFNTPFANTGGQDQMTMSEEEQLLVIRRLHKVLRPFLLRRLKKDVEKDLPDKQERVIKCTMSSLQAKLYKGLMTTNKLMISDGKGGKTGVRGLSNMLMQLRKLCNHPFVFEEVENQINPKQQTNDLLWRTAGKFELLDRVLPKFQATGHRVLMFFQMTQIMNIMEDFMRLRGFQYLRLDGGTKSEERADLLKLFNAPNSPYFCFLLSTRAGGLGLNLQTADTVIIYDSDWNPHQDLQAQDRAHRIGQKNEVRILRLITSNSVEEKILERAQYKLDMDGKVIQAGKFDNKSTNEEREAMLRVMLESAEAADSLEQDEMDDDDLNMMMMRGDEELEVFQKMDAERIKNGLYGPGKPLPRLLSEPELPDIYLQDDDVTEEVVEEVFVGRGARERTRVRYDDGLTEEQWLEAVDNSDDDLESAIRRKQDRKDRKVAKQEKRIREENGILGDSPPADSRDSSEEPPTAQKKRGRKPGSAKRKADDASLDSESIAAAPPPKRRGRQPKAIPETLSPTERAALQAALDAVHDNLMDLESEPMPGYNDRRQIIDPFLSLPPRNDYPDYYQLIRNPICMENIGNKVNEKRYQSMDEFGRDVRLLCDNARQYNEDGSLLYQDANLIEATALRLLAEESSKHPDLGKALYTGAIGGGTSGATGTATPATGPGTGAAPSGLGTPINVRLNFGGGST